jgi:alpha-amylase/alpha-mannosidase (GH57 family)
LRRWQGIAQHLFWRKDFAGFWPPEMAFCMELIPKLKHFGYRYAIVGSEHVEPLTPMRWEEIRYRPHVARHEGQELVVIVRDRDLSYAQESGMDHGWFMQEVHQRTKSCDFPPMVTTCTDGDNGGWFRNVSPKGNFWGAFYQPLLELVRRGETEVRPTFIDDYLDQYGAHGEVRIRSGAWNTGWHNGSGFTQWTGSQTQKEALERITQTSHAFHDLKKQIESTMPDTADSHHRLAEAQWHLLRAETSCNFYWGEAWVARCHQDLNETWKFMNEVAASSR